MGGGFDHQAIAHVGRIAGPGSRKWSEMPALSFGGEWLDKLLSGSKRQTTRPQTDRIKVGDVCTIYNQQRRRIVDKPLRKLTVFGNAEMCFRGYPNVPLMLDDAGFYHAHLLGKVEIAEVYDILPIQCTCGENTWAKRDGFTGDHDAFVWFENRYGEGWVKRWWTVIRWGGWMERYFEPMEAI